MISMVGGYNFMIEGTLGDINPLTKDTINEFGFGDSHVSKSTVVEIEV